MKILLALFPCAAFAASFSHNDPNCAGWSMDASGTITCKTAQMQPPVCSSLVASPPAGGQTTITATCSGLTLSSAYTWSAVPPPISGFYDVTAGPTQTVNIGATTTFSVQAWNEAGGSNVVTTPVGLPVAGCTNYLTAPVALNWAAPGRYYTGNVMQYQIIVASFVAGEMTPGRASGSISASNYGSPETQREAFLSPQPCDFTTPPVLGWNASSYGSVPYIVFSTSGASGVPLAPGTTYYMSIKTTGPCTTCNMAIDLVR